MEASTQQQTNQPAVASKLLAPTASFAIKKAAVVTKPAPAKVEKTQKGPTIPNSPKFHRTNHSTSVMSKEEREAAEVAALKAAEQKRIEQNKRAYEKLKATATVAAKSVSSTRSTKQLTIPETPMHNLTNRMGIKEPAPKEVKDEVKKTLDFDKSNNSEKEAAPVVDKGPTMPKPFKFATDRRFGSAAENKSAAAGTATVGELIAQFQKDPRSHYVPAKAASGLTVARAPVFETDRRLNAVSRDVAPSREEREAAMMEEFQRHAFKAKPVGSTVPVAAPGSVAHGAAPKQLTEFKPFQLQTEKRGAARAPAPSPAAAPTDVFMFKARPMPTFTAEEIPTSPSDVQKQLTIPHSPAFHGAGGRASSAPARRQLPHHSETEAQRRSALASVKEEASQPPRTRGEGGVTRPRPFHLYTGDRGNMYKQLLQQKIEAEREAERRMHDLAPAAATAAPIPAAVKDGSKVFAPKTSSKPLTVVEEFPLTSTQKHEQAQRQLEERRREEERRRREEASFHARPVPTAILAEPDFVSYLPSEGAPVGNGQGMGAPPRKSLMPQDVKLVTAERVAQRAAFDAEVTVKMDALAVEKAEAKRLREEAEAAEIKALRRKSIAEGGFCFKSSNRYEPATPAATAVPKSIFTAFVPGAADVPVNGVANKENPQQQFAKVHPATTDGRMGKTAGGRTGGPVRIRPFGENAAPSNA